MLYKMFLTPFVLAVELFSIKQQLNQPTMAKSPSFSKKELFINKIIQNMTILEKLGQLTQINVGQIINRQTLEINTDMLDYYVQNNMVGSFFNNMVEDSSNPPADKYKWVKILNQIQAKYLTSTRLKIPMVFGIDSIHGANYILNATLFPQQLGMASTFNRELVRKCGAITAKDTRAVGIHWNFSPVLDIAVNKQWGRVFETFGEDPYLAADLGKEIISGYQGFPVDLKNPTKVAATMKHFIGYSATRSGKDVDGNWLNDRILYDYFLKPYLAANEVGVATTMESYNDNAGEHVVSSKKYLVDVLRKKVGFKGVLVTDWEQINKLHIPIAIAESQKEAVYIAMRHGSIDMSMVPENPMFITHMLALINEGRIPTTLVDKNVKRVLSLKYELGLLQPKSNNIFVEKDSSFVKSIGSSADNLVSLETAREGVIMLKNNNKTLPLTQNMRVLVIGPTSSSLRFQNGGWTHKWQGPENDAWFNTGSTIFEGIKAKIGELATHMEYIDINGVKTNPNINFMDLVNNYDAAVVCLGESNYVEFHGNINDMRLPKGQTDLLVDLKSAFLNKPVVLVLSQGRPRVLDNSIISADAILNGFLLGPHAGQAFGDVIFGDVNPSGKLPLTYANNVNDNTLNYYRRVNEQYTDVEWEFGHGLSYTTFSYSNLELGSNIMKVGKNTSLKVSVVVKNNGDLPGKEVVMVYLRDEFRSISPEFKKLIKYEKIFLNKKEQKKISFYIDYKDLAFYDENNMEVIQAGTFFVYVSSLKATFTLALPLNQTKYQLL